MIRFALLICVFFASSVTLAIPFSEINIGDELTLLEDMALKETETARENEFSRGDKLTVQYKMTRIVDPESPSGIQNENIIIFRVFSADKFGEMSFTDYEAKATGNEFGWLTLK